MKITGEYYSFEMPPRWKGIVGARKKGRNTDIILLWEDDPECSGLLVSLKCLKRQKKSPDEYTELLGTLSAEGEGRYYLYAAYGREGAVSEENEDLYWRLRDQLYLIFDSIQPASGCLWQPAGRD